MTQCALCGGGGHTAPHCPWRKLDQLSMAADRLREEVASRGVALWGEMFTVGAHRLQCYGVPYSNGGVRIGWYRNLRQTNWTAVKRFVEETT